MRHGKKLRRLEHLEQRKLSEIRRYVQHVTENINDADKSASRVLKHPQRYSTYQITYHTLQILYLNLWATCANTCKYAKSSCLYASEWCSIPEMPTSCTGLTRHELSDTKEVEPSKTTNSCNDKSYQINIRSAYLISVLDQFGFCSFGRLLHRPDPNFLKLRGTNAGLAAKVPRESSSDKCWTSVHRSSCYRQLPYKTRWR